MPIDHPLRFVTRCSVLIGSGDDSPNFGAVVFGVGDAAFASGTFAEEIAANPVTFELGGLYRRHLFGNAGFWSVRAGFQFSF
jgi:hypothetical protein